MTVFLEGLAIGGYRSFGSEPQLLGPLSKINILAGQNNSGKSNVLAFITEHYRNAIEAVRREPRQWSFKDTDRHVGATDRTLSFGVGIALGSARYDGIINHHGLSSLGRQGTQLMEKLLSHKKLRRGTDVVWFVFSGQQGQKLMIPDWQEYLTDDELQEREWRSVWERITSQSGGGANSWVPQTLQALAPVHENPPAVALVPAIRRISQGPASDADYSGLGIIERLAQVQNPGFLNLEAKKRFDEINQFLRDVVGDSEAQLEIPYERDVILVHMGGKTLPLDSLGTGIHEVVILASVATVVRDQIVCMEEPELHLHPVLQRKLLRYLADKTSNQYFITTHSAHLLDTPGAAVFHIKQEHGQSVVAGAFQPSQKAAIATDLGYRASDILQTNCVIWVEGPSDRVYIQWWLSSLAPDLIEGLHYSIMFYGGRLLSHLSADDPDVSEFISLRRLNRNMVIVIDSDKRSSKARINDTKRRVRDELVKYGGIAWITAGKEIENYVPLTALRAAVHAEHPKAKHEFNGGMFDAPLRLTNRAGTSTAPDKVRIARRVASAGPPDVTTMDLARRLRQLEAFVRAANETD